ncbi:MAG: putative Ig domain-containing protein [Colwellia sp.]|nr:putative Ig domain-containing protein [Colwellia sp.]MCW9082268.1 putative Ig domain-containing protein [Colwellia sp.]
MPIFQTGKFTTNTLKLGVVSSSILLSACTLDESSNNAPVFDEVPVSVTTLTVGERLDDQLKATDADDDVILYTVTSKPSWLELSQSGTLSSYPLEDSDVGTYTVTFKAADSDDSVTRTVTYTVLNSLPSAPALNAESTTLFTGTDFNAELSATDVGETPLIFSLVSSTLNGTDTDWLQVLLNEDNSYALVGTPSEAEAGDTTVVVAVTDGMDTVESSFTLTVEVPPPNDAPGAPTVDNNVATEGVDFIATLAATDTEGDALTFTVDGALPAWLGQNGAQLIGKPNTADVGQHDISIIVSDGINTNAAQTVTITVVGTAPTDFIISGNNGATENSPIVGASLSATKDTTDDTLTYSIETGPAWLTVDGASGDILGTPSLADVGTNSFTAKVTDINGLFAELDFTVEVEALPIVNVAPTFNSLTIYKPGGAEASDYSLAEQSLADDATDTNGDMLTFSKTAGPAWLTVNADGSLAGLLTNFEADGTTPAVNTFTVEVSDPDGLTGTATLNITKAIFNLAELNTAAVPVGRAFAATLSGDNGHGTQDTLTYSETEGDTSDLFTVSESGAVTSSLLTVTDVGAHKIKLAVTNGVQTTQTPDLSKAIATTINVVEVTPIDGSTDIFGPKVADLSGWVNETSINTISANNNAPVIDGRYLRVKGGSHAVKYFDSTGFSSVSISFERRFEQLNLIGDDTDDHEIYGAEWSTDGATWTLIEPETNNAIAGTDWVSVGPIVLPAGAAEQPYLAIRFRTNGDDNLSRVHIDNVTVTGTP